jgi:hypothetical protein
LALRAGAAGAREDAGVVVVSANHFGGF